MYEQFDVDASNAPPSPDSPGFDDFYQAEHAEQVRRAYLLVRSNEAANDIVHDAMIGVLRRWGELDNPAGYLNRAVLNGCRDHGRRRVSRADVVRRLGPDATDIDQHRSANDVLDDVLATLPFRHRAAVVLRYYCGFSTAEIAEALDCPANSVGPWITRALATMKKELS